MLINSQEIKKVINIVRPLIRQKIDMITEAAKGPTIQYKADSSPVTELDLYISDLFKSELLKKFPNLNFYSEEDKGKFEFPVCILDPIDGTKEFIAGRDEWVISFGIYQTAKVNSPDNFSWIYNPQTGFEISSETLITRESILKIGKEQAMVSRTEYASGLCDNYKSRLNIKPVGSIAYKLALLASGEGALVFSKRDKNIWDILAGTHICITNGIDCYQNGEIVEMISPKLYESDFVWCSQKQDINEYDFIFEK